MKTIRTLVAVALIMLWAGLSAHAQNEGSACSSNNSEEIYKAKAKLRMRADAPSIWRTDLPEQIGELKVGECVKVLERREYNTLVSQREWILIEKINSASIKSAPRGWVFGGTSGELLQRQ